MNSSTDAEKMNCFKFSVVMAIYNSEDYLENSIDSVINQSIGFEENIQLILVNDGSIDSSEEICLRYQEKYPNNILVLSQENQGQASARNNGLRQIQGKYVNFLDSDDCLKENAFEEVFAFFEKHYNETDIVSIPVCFFDREKGQHITNGKFDEGARVIDLVKEPNNIQLHVNSAFIKNECFEKFSFPTNVILSEDVILVNKILLEKKTLGVLDTTKYYYRKRFDESSTIDKSVSRKEYYNDKLSNYFLHLIEYAKSKEGEVPEFLIYALAYDLQWVFELSDLSVLDDNERKDFFKYLREIVDYIPSEVILNNRYIANPYRRDYFLSFKENDFHAEITESNNVLLKINDYVADNLLNHRIWFDIIEFDNGFLNVSGLFNSLYDIRNISIEAIREKENGETDSFIGKYARYTSRRDIRYFDEIFQFRNNFDMKIPIAENEASRIKFRINFHKDGDNTNFEEDNVVSNYLDLDFQPHAKISKLSNYTFKDSNIIYFDNNVFTLIPYSFKNLIKKEYHALRNILREKEHGYKYAILLRLVYLITYPIFKAIKGNREIYLFEDRIDVGDDNANHLFNYAINIDDNVKKYFVLSKDSPQYKELSKIGNVLNHGSFRHKLMIFHTDKIICSHPYESFLNPFYDYIEDERQLYAGLINYKIYFVQHGVTLGDISTWLSKYDKNLSLISAASQKEHDSFLAEGYNYDEEIIQILGLPRFDNLKNNPNKQILIIPSWRNYLRGNKKAFLNSMYFKNLNSLLNDKDLIRLIEEYGYNIVFKAHPELNNFIEESDERYIDLLDIPKEITLSNEESYQDLFNNSSIMITDYSSVFFDFAYLKKPVIYYQKEEDYHYSYSYFDIETMGFGEIIKTEDDLIAKVKYYLENNCILEDKYQSRVDDFFKFKDQNNCKRVYDWIKEH